MGERIIVSDHAASRYVERVRQGITLGRAHAELEALIDLAGETSDTLPWVPESPPDADGYLILSDGICLALRRNKGRLVGITVLTRAERSAAYRAAKNKRRRERARGRATRRYHEKHSYRGRPQEEAA